MVDIERKRAYQRAWAKKKLHEMTPKEWRLHRKKKNAYRRALYLRLRKKDPEGFKLRQRLQKQKERYGHMAKAHGEIMRLERILGNKRYTLILKYREEGLNNAEIGDLFSITRQAVYQFLKGHK